MGESQGVGAATIFIVRHADAGSRSERRDDHLRPLSVSGRHQAQDVAHLLDGAPVGHILSSPYIRCVETVQPLAAQQLREVVCADALAEGAAIAPLLRLLAGVPDRTVVCTHGDVLRSLVDAIGDTHGFHSCFDKGVAWVLARTDGDFSVVRVIPPLTATSPTQVSGGPRELATPVA